MDKKLAMISQPMNGKSDMEIICTRDKALKTLTDMGYEVINTLFSDEWMHREEIVGVAQIPVLFLAKSIESMSKCYAVYFCKGWKEARGCRIEHEIAKAYGLDIVYEEKEEIKDE